METGTSWGRGGGEGEVGQRVNISNNKMNKFWVYNI